MKEAAIADQDPELRRAIPRTDYLLGLPEVEDARRRLGERRIRELVATSQQRARDGLVGPDAVVDVLVGALDSATSTALQPVLNATGIVVHTNLGRAPLSPAAVDAVIAASGYVDVELDLGTGERSGRGLAARAALLAACPDAEEALVVNNGAAALLLAATALAVDHSAALPGEILVSRGELVEIGAGFRIPELIESTGARLREVGTTNRTYLHDYAGAVSERTRGILKIHPSNYRVSGFTAEASIAELHGLARERDLPLIVDQGSGLLAPDSVLPGEPDVQTALRAGADLVIASGDKLLGGPQAGLILGRADVVRRLAKHPLARAVRIDKLRLAALEATLVGPNPPVTEAIHALPADLERRTRELAAEVGAEVVEHDGRVGGGGAPGFPLPGFAVRLAESAAARLRAGDPPVLARTHDGACLVDLRCIPAAADERLALAVRTALGG